MRKIAILVPDLVLGGGQRVAVNTAHLLAKKHSVEIVIFSKENQLFTSDIWIINLNIPKSKSFLGKLFNVFRRAYSYKKLLIKQQYDFTISFLESANLCAFLTTRKKSILTFHCHPNLLTTSDQLILRHLFKFSNQLVAVSQGLKLTLEKSYIKKHVSVINNAVDPISIKQQSREESFTHPRDFIVAVGRLSQEKQFSKLIDIYCQCKASKELDLIIIGC